MQPLEFFLRFFFSGFFLSTLYILVTIGLTMIFGVMGIVNFAHGSFAILGGYLCYVFVSTLGINPLIALIPATVTVLGVGYFIFHIFTRYTFGVGDVHVVHYYALLLIIANALALFFGLDYRLIESQYAYEQIGVGDVNISFIKLIVSIIAIGTVLVLNLMLRKTSIGRKIRAVSQNLDAAKILGIDTEQVRLVTWCIGIGSAGLMGALIGMVNPFSPYAGSTYLIVAFTVAILGGMGSFIGTMIAGFIIGMSESLFSLILPSQVSPAIAFLIIIAVLVFRPGGIAGEG